MPSESNKHTILDVSQKREVILYALRNNISHESISIHFSKKFGRTVSRRTVTRIISEKDKWLGMDVNDNKLINRKEKYPKLEEALKVFVNSANSQNLIVNDEILVEKAKKIGERLMIPKDFLYSHGWLQRFKSRNKLRQITLHGEASSCSTENLDEKIDLLRKELEIYDPGSIYNFDETALFYKMMPSKTISSLSKKSGTKQSKQRVSLAVCCNADGTDKLPLLMIGTAKKPRCFQNFNYSSMIDYKHNSRGWMTSLIFNEWLTCFDKKMRDLRKQVILLIDNAPSHKITIDLTNIKIIFLPPNLTSVLQPLDAGVIACLKRYYRKKLVNKHLINFEKGDKSDITLRDAVMFLHQSWFDVKEITIKNCFKHVKYVTFTEEFSYVNNELCSCASENEQLRVNIQKFENLTGNEAISVKDYVEFENNLHINQEEAIDIDQIIEIVNEKEENEFQNSILEEENEVAIIKQSEAEDCFEKVFDFFTQQRDATSNDYDILYKLKSRMAIIKSNKQKQSNLLDFCKMN